MRNLLMLTVLFSMTVGFPIAAYAVGDCDGNGIDDAIDIAAGRLVDVEGNGIPDCCERGYPCGVNLIQNGGFESGPMQPCGWVLLEPNATNLLPWRVIYGSVDRVRISPSCPTTESWRSFLGEYTIDLSGQQSGKLEQSVPTRPGYRYVLSLATSTNGGQSSGTRSMRLQAGPLDTTFSQTLTPFPAQWIVRSVEFVADAPVTTVALSDQSGVPTLGMVIDDVRLVPFGTVDCNGDGLYDYEQILSGQLPDANNNGIPDWSVSISRQPTNQAVGVDQPVYFSVEVSSSPSCTTPVSYRWQRRNPQVLDPNAPNAWVDLSDGGGFLNTGTASLTILRPTAGLATGYRCKISGGCGCEGIGTGVLYTNVVNFAPACPSDFNLDGSVDGDDVIAFFERWDGGC